MAWEIQAWIGTDPTTSIYNLWEQCSCPVHGWRLCFLSSNTFTSGWPCAGGPLQTATGPESRRLGHNKPSLSSLIHCQRISESIQLTRKATAQEIRVKTALSSRCQCKTCHALFTARWHWGREVCKWVCICECLCAYLRECKQARLTF